jgi:hypothetical protein
MPTFNACYRGLGHHQIHRDPAASFIKHPRNPWFDGEGGVLRFAWGARHAVPALRAMRGHAHGHKARHAWVFTAHHWKALEYSFLVHFSSPKSIECAQSYGRSCVGTLPDHHGGGRQVGTGSRTRNARCSRVMHRFLTHIDAVECPRAWPSRSVWASADPSEQQPSAVHRSHSAAFPRSPGQEYSPRRLNTAICRPECAAEACTSAAG